MLIKDFMVYKVVYRYNTSIFHYIHDVLCAAISNQQSTINNHYRTT